jgi:hypothetical protein
MRFSIRDLFASVLVAATVVPYIGYLVNGSMPFIRDTRGVVGTGLVLGIAAFLVARRPAQTDRLTRWETGLGIATLVIGATALGIAEAAGGPVLPATFIAAVVAVWGFEMLHHAGVVHVRVEPPAPTSQV